MPIRVTVHDGDGKEHKGDFPSFIDDKACVVCKTLHSGMNLLGMSQTFFCNDCWYKMGMRPVGGGAYAHTGEDVLFKGDQANSPACPTHDPAFGVCTPYEIIMEVKDKPLLWRAINE